MRDKVNYKGSNKGDFLKEEKLIRAAIHSIPGIGGVRLRALIEAFGSARSFWYRLKQENRSENEKWLRKIREHQKNCDLKVLEEWFQVNNIQIIIPEEEGYPHLLRHCVDAPPLLYYKGHLQTNVEALAIVGSRRSTPYGRSAAEFLAKDLAQEDIIVVSGLARGIDSAAHRGALKGNGITWAVMGCGLLHMYPPENKSLAEEILDKKGAIWSEFYPTTPPTPQLFPVRNRLISGMSRGVVVVEAALRSGALITVDFALEQGREVFAIPGPIFSEQSKGTHHLLRQGAKLVENYHDIASEIPTWTMRKQQGKNAQEDISDNEKTGKKGFTTAPEGKEEHQKILELLNYVPIHIDQIIQNTGLSPEEIPLYLLELQLAGKI
ncbi:MAG: DNA-protecting protein DprA, partial [Desulfitobacterium sp.]|nr:DNA-protecting protein DprA [Desulfitobacterium sp.]